jgi:hypothetical protein
MNYAVFWQCSSSERLQAPGQIDLLDGSSGRFLASRHQSKFYQVNPLLTICEQTSDVIKVQFVVVLIDAPIDFAR